MRKVLSFVLVLALVLSSFTMAFAADAPAAGLSDIDGNANEEAIQVCNDLGIVTGNPDSTFQPDKAVNRAEFAAMITRAMAIPESALVAYTSTSFKDTAGYGWAVSYLAFCESKGIMLGDGQGNAMPGRTINTNEAMTMVLRAVGYTANSSELVGIWPSNYVTIAQNVGLYDDVASASDVNKAAAAQVIYNALTVQKVAVNTDGKTDKLWKDEANDVEGNLLNTGLNCDDELGTIGAGLNQDGIINLQKYMGLYGTAYLNTDEEIVAFIPDSAYVEGDWTADDDDKFDHYVDADKEYTFADTPYYGPKSNPETPLVDATDVPYFENGARNGSTSISALADDGTYTFAATVSGKTLTRLYSISAWDVDFATQVGAADLDDFEDQEFLGYDFTLDNNDEIDYNSFELVGATALDKIEVDDVVYVYLADSKITKIAVGTETVTGDVTKLDGDAADGKFYVGSTKYALSGEKATTRPDAGDNVTLYLDAYGDVYDYDTNDSTPDTYAVVQGYAFGDDVDSTRVKLYTSEDSSKTFDVVGNSDLTITTGKSITVEALAAGTIVKKQLLGYGLDKDGKIESLDGTAVTSAGFFLDSAKVLRDLTASKTYEISPDVVVFTYDKDKDEYDVEKIENLKTKADKAGALTGSSIGAASAIIDSDDGVVALLVDIAAAGKSADDVYAVINEFNTVYDSEQDEKVKNVIGFADGVALDKNADKDSYTATTASVKLYKITYDGSGYINDVADAAGVTGVTVVDATTINAIGSDNMTIGTGDVNGDSTWYEVAKDAIVYQVTDANTADQVYKLSSVNSLKASTASSTYTVALYDTDNEEDGYEVVIFWK